MAREIALIFVILLGFCVQGLNAFLLRSAFIGRSSILLRDKISDKIVVEFQPSNKIIQAREGEQLSAVAVKAGVEINYKCRKGECGTCQVKIDNKWVKACQTTVTPPSTGDVLFVNVKPATEEAKKKPSKFFTPASFIEGVINNGAGVIGFVTEALKVDDEFQARMEREKRLKEKIAEKKRQGGANSNGNQNSENLA